MTQKVSTKLKRAKRPPSWIAEQEQYENCIGRIAMSFPLIHIVLERFAWTLWGLAEEFGSILTRDLPTRQLATKIMASLKEIDIDDEVQKELKALLKRVEQLSERRNDLFHSIWSLKDGKPVLISRKTHFKNPKESPDLHALEELFNSVADLVDDLWTFSRKNILLGAMGLTARKKYGNHGDKLMPKHHDTA